MSSKPFDLDVRGLSCPEPVLRVKRMLDAGGERLRILADSRVAMENISRLARQSGVSFSAEEREDQYYILLSREV